jgi:hypothetical protein
MVSSRGKRRKSRYRIFLTIIVVAALLVGVMSVCYWVFCNQAFGDKGLASTKLPSVYEAPSLAITRLKLGQQFANKHSSTADTIVFPCLGCYPLIPNSFETRNKSKQFVGYSAFLDAMQFGERLSSNGIFKPAVFASATHSSRPGIVALRKALSASNSSSVAGEELPAPITSPFYIEYHWWLFPTPATSPTKGMKYTIFAGDFKELIELASKRGFDFMERYFEGLTLALDRSGVNLQENGKDLGSKVIGPHHVLLKAWMSLSCTIAYLSSIKEADAEKLVKCHGYLNRLQQFMNQHLIRYPADWKCLNRA